MALFTRPIRTLDDLFLHLLQDMYYAERQIARVLPGMMEKMRDPELRQAFAIHLAETGNQIVRLDRAFELHGSGPRATTCQAIDGILQEADGIASDVADPEVLHAVLLATAQAVKHYEIARYGTMIAIARQLGLTTVAEALEPTLEEEKATDGRLGDLGTRMNRQSAMA